MQLGCPHQAELLALLARDAPPHGPVRRHALGCPECGRVLGRLRAEVNALQAAAIVKPRTWSSCLDDGDVAGLIEGGPGPADPEILAHLAECGACGHRVASVAWLGRGNRVAAELRRLDGSADARRPRRMGPAVSVGAGAVLAAAALAAVLLAPADRSRTGELPPAGEARHRESAITITVAPEIVGPRAPAVPGDSLRWTSVPHADRYRVTVFDREGTAVLDRTTGDTAMAIPGELIRARTATYLWKVEARTGWDRWVASEWSDLTLGPSRPE